MANTTSPLPLATGDPPRNHPASHAPACPSNAIPRHCGGPQEDKSEKFETVPDYYFAQAEIVSSMDETEGLVCAVWPFVPQHAVPGLHQELVSAEVYVWPGNPLVFVDWATRN